MLNLNHHAKQFSLCCNGGINYFSNVRHPSLCYILLFVSSFAYKACYALHSPLYFVSPSLLFRKSATYFTLFLIQHRSPLRFFLMSGILLSATFYCLFSHLHRKPATHFTLPSFRLPLIAYKVCYALYTPLNSVSSLHRSPLRNSRSSSSVIRLTMSGILHSAATLVTRFAASLTAAKHGTRFSGSCEYVHVCACVCMCKCARLCVRVFVHVCVCACVCICV